MIPRHTAFKGCGARQTDYPKFTGRMGSSPSRAPDSADRRTVDDHTATLRHHLEKFCLHAVPNAPQGDIGYVVKLIIIHFLHRRSLAVYSGIIEGRLEPAKGSDRLLDHRLDLAPVCHIAGDRQEPDGRLSAALQPPPSRSQHQGAPCVSCVGSDGDEPDARNQLQTDTRIGSIACWLFSVTTSQQRK
jgi:hypothetical protein